MHTVFTIITLILAAATFIVLSWGIVNMLQTSRGTAHKNNKLMRWRIILQALTLLSFGLMLWSVRI